ncbi:hypothetical protein JTB14_010924 [Gonioctena quinquepunctata]|nr:hypothetical protein JTB14_010924 [Gonioctena quinquepunctata]
MKGVGVLFFLGLCLNWAQAQFFNNRPYPTYSLENMPETGFSCRDKILGGYYADADTQCQMFHVCVKVAGVGIQDFRFLCPNGTAFDQDHQICADWEDIDCDATTLYYSSDNFDLYRIGSGFESKAVKYGEDEETFSLQRAETGDARINREQQSNVVNQRKETRYFKPRPNNQNSNGNNNNEKDLFKGSSSSNFYNNRNNGKERDEDYDDNVNVNQDKDFEQKRKVVRNKVRRPVQSNDNKNQNNDYNKNTQNNDYNRNSQNNDYNRNNQNNDYNRNDRNQNSDYNRNSQNNEDVRKSQNNDNNKNNQNNDANRRSENNYQEAQTRRPSATRNTGFTNNFAGSSYIPTTSRSTSTTLNADQYSTAFNNYRSRNGQRQRQYTDSDSPTYTISTPAPFKQTQQYNPPPNRQANNQFYSTTLAPQKETENYPQQKPKQTTAFENYDIPKVKQTGTTSAQTYNTQYDISKARNTGSTPSQGYNTQYDTPKVKQTGSTAQQYNTQYEATKSKLASTTAQYEATKVKQTNNYPTTIQRTDNYPSNNPKYSTFDKKSTTPFKQTENYPTTLSPKPFSLNNFPTTFAPRTNAGYSQIAQQTVNYSRKQNTQTTQSSPNSQSTGLNQQARGSTPRGNAFTQYTPTVPKLSSTTPVSRSSRFDETQYDDGSYSSKYDNDNDKKEDEFLKTAHSQNIAASRNEFAKTTKGQPSTQTQRTYESPRPFSVTPRPFSVTPRVVSTEAPKTSPKVEQIKKDLGTKKTKDVSYDYAYYDSNPASEPEYDINTDIQKSTTRN